MSDLWSVLGVRHRHDVSLPMALARDLWDVVPLTYPGSLPAAVVGCIVGEQTALHISEAEQGRVVEGAARVPDDGTARIGGVRDGASFLQPTPAPPPVVATRRQSPIALAAAGFLTAEEALAAKITWAMMAMSTARIR
jgi:hypothetical protein